MTFARFQDQANAVLALDPIKLERRAELGSQLYFSLAPGIVTNLQKLINSVDQENASVVPESVWENVSRQIYRFAEITEEISNFNSFQGNPAEYRDQLENDLKHQYGEIFSQIAPAIAAISASVKTNTPDDFLSQIESNAKNRFDTIAASFDEQSKAAAAKIDNLVKSATFESEQSAESLRTLLEETRNRAAEIISTKEAAHFATASVEFQESSQRWLITTIFGISVLLILSVVALIVASSGFYSELNTVSATQVGISKIILFGVVGYVTAQSAKNFFAAKHNEAVNKHRQNAILAYRALVEATGSPEHRDIVLTHAAAAVFAPQDTAFVKGASGGTEIPATFINSVTKAVSPTS